MGLGNYWSIKKLWDWISKGIKKPELFKDNKYWQELFERAWKVEEIRIIIRRNVLTVLKGKKTYLVAIGIGAVGAAHALGFIDDATFKALMVMLTGGGLAALRAGVTKNK